VDYAVGGFPFSVLLHVEIDAGVVVVTLEHGIYQSNVQTGIVLLQGFPAVVVHQFDQRRLVQIALRKAITPVVVLVYLTVAHRTIATVE
jgi:hypothetical protein